MTSGRSVVVTLAMGRGAEQLDYTFTSFLKNPTLELHAFILGPTLPARQVSGVNYHLLPPVPDYSDPLREVYYRRMEVLDTLDVDFALTVDCLDVLCLRPLPALGDLLGGADVAACVEHLGSRYIMGQGYTANFLNGGVFFWNVKRSQDIRAEIVGRGKRHFRTVADDQWSINEVIQTKHFQRLRILPCQYNYRADLRRKRRGWPSVQHLDGVMIYHNAACMDEAKSIAFIKPQADLAPLPDDSGPIASHKQIIRKIRLRLKPHVVK